MRLLGHPVHPILVHFPIVFWITGAAADALHWVSWLTDPTVALWSLGLGSAVGAIAMLPGFLDLIKLDEKFVPTANKHAMFMCVAWLLFLISFGVRMSPDTSITGVPVWILLVDLMGTITLAAGGILGGELVHKYGVTQRESSNS